MYHLRQPNYKKSAHTLLDQPDLRVHRLAHRVEGPRTPLPTKTTGPAIAVVRELDPVPIEATSTHSHEPRPARAIVTLTAVGQHQVMDGTDGTAGIVRFRGCHSGPVEWHVREHHTCMYIDAV